MDVEDTITFPIIRTTVYHDDYSSSIVHLLGSWDYLEMQKMVLSDMLPRKQSIAKSTKDVDDSDHFMRMEATRGPEPFDSWGYPTNHVIAISCATPSPYYYILRRFMQVHTWLPLYIRRMPKLVAGSCTAQLQVPTSYADWGSLPPAISHFVASRLSWDPRVRKFCGRFLQSGHSIYVSWGSSSF
jgi:hypothetical protein